MSVLAVFAFSEASVVTRRRLLRWAGALMFPDVPVELPRHRSQLLRDAGVEPDAGQLTRAERSMLDLVYRSHWLV
ncbi:hypothetical protein [Ensifer sp.]|jgi:hypothetical protein|uniref:hypothetical protein n=1 Tax=Ensifer sp. TaxID=1872086 RepID=UPI002E135B49|nr:hypothetical protein [Ensifer sp.]